MAPKSKADFETNVKDFKTYETVEDLVLSGTEHADEFSLDLPLDIASSLGLSTQID